MRDKKILFVVSTILHYRNYLKTKALEEIKDRLYFLVNPGLANLDFGVPADRIFSYSFPGHKEMYYRHAYNINRWKKRKKSFNVESYFSMIKPRRLLIYKILSLPVLSTIFKFYFIERGKDKKLLEIIQKIGPSLVLIPSNFYDGMAFELIRICKKINVPSFALVDNWDNICGKTIFIIKPDYIGVWSQQCEKHALNIAEMPKDRIFVLGTPKFIDYFKPENKHLSSPYPFKYILYAGTSFHYNEIGALKKIDELIEKNNLDIKVVFRPAQRQQKRDCPDIFFEYNFKHTILDIPARAYYKREAGVRVGGGFNPIYAPDLGYYPRILSNMEFMICPLSTMIIEGSLFDKKVYILAYDDGIAPDNLKYLFHNFIHFKGVDHLKNARMVYNFEDLEKIFTPGDTLKQSLEPIDLDYFISREATANYPANLKRIVDKILTSWYS